MTLFRKAKRIILTAAIAIIIIAPAISLAEEPKTGAPSYQYTLLEPLPISGGELSSNVSLSEYISWAFRAVLALAGFLSVLMITIGGVQYIASGASVSNRDEAKDRITNAIYGLVLAFASYLLLQTINPQLVNVNLDELFKSRRTSQQQVIPTKNGQSEPIYAVKSTEKPQTAHTINEGGESYQGTRQEREIEYDNGSKAYETVDTYMDKGNNLHTITTTKDSDGVSHTKEVIDKSDGGYEIWKNGVKQ